MGGLGRGGSCWAASRRRSSTSGSRRWCWSRQPKTETNQRPDFPGRNQGLTPIAVSILNGDNTHAVDQTRAREYQFDGGSGRFERGTGGGACGSDGGRIGDGG